MIPRLFKIWLVALFCISCPGKSKGEIIEIVKMEPQIKRVLFSRTASMPDTGHWLKPEIKKQKSVRAKGRKANRKGATIFVIVLLSIGAIIFAGIGLIYLALAFELAGDSLATIGLILGIAGLTLGVLCVVGLFKQVRKLKKLNRGETLEENKSNRPPTKKMNQ
ncbi:MAG: hypothetical protein DYG98_25780 [Haliscomenobacteraceae bacterium CHB4]|nr:hypothetical protein [Haliscomenobacteraceae bacterium CHB4]